MKRDIDMFVEQCSTYQHVKVEHQRPIENLQPLLIPKWKCDDIAMDLKSDYRGPQVERILYG